VKVRVGYGLGTRTVTNDAERFGALVDGLEALRFDSLWLSEKITDDCPDPVVALSFAAARTTRLKLGTSVMVLPGRNPMLLAKELASLDRLSSGRLLPAFGLGQVDPGEQQAFGVERTERAKRFDEALPLLRRFWTEDAVDHEGDREEVAVAQALRGLDDLLRRGLAGHADDVAQRQRADDVARRVLLAARDDRGDAVALDDEPLDGGLHEDLAATLVDAVGHLLPHLAGAEAGIIELLDERLDLLVLVAEERGLRGGHERQVLDPLRRPFGAQLGAGHAPHLLGVGLEEQLVQALAEAVGDPLLQTLLVALAAEDRGAEVREDILHLFAFEEARTQDAVRQSRVQKRFFEHS